MYGYLNHRLSGADQEPAYDRRSTPDDDDPTTPPQSDESDDSDEEEELHGRSLSISPATLANALEINDIHDRNGLASVQLNEFLTDLVQKEYVWKLKKRDIKQFTSEVTGKIADTYGGSIPKEINKEVLIESLPTEQCFLVQIGHKVQSSSFIKCWQNYDVDGSGYIEIKEIRLLVKDYAQVAGEDISGHRLNRAIEQMMKDLDTNHDGKIELEELTQLMNVENNFMKNFCGRQHLHRKDFDRIFSHYDTDGQECLEKSEVMALINDILKHQETSGKNVPIPLLQKTYAQVMKICDENNSDTIQKRELALLLSCFNLE